MQTIGERLEEARKKKGVSIREAAEATKIRGDYLQKFESNQFDIGLTEIYTRGFLRTYASFLKVPPDRIMSDYAALGRGDVRPRQPNREVYGRMDISVASANEAAERAGQSEQQPAQSDASAARQQQPHYPRGTGTSLPSGIDPATMYKWMKIGGVIVGFILLLIIAQIVYNSATSGSGAAPAKVAPASPTIVLAALNTVQVRVQRANPDGSAAETIFEGTLNRGETRRIDWPGELVVTASAAENLQFEVGGRRFPMGQTGYATGKLPAPKR